MNNQNILRFRAKKILFLDYISSKKKKKFWRLMFQNVQRNRINYQIFILWRRQRNENRSSFYFLLIQKKNDIKRKFSRTVFFFFLSFFFFPTPFAVEIHRIFSTLKITRLCSCHYYVIRSKKFQCQLSWFSFK